MRVLIVDDSRTARIQLRESLKELKAEVFEAANGVEALDALKKHDPIRLAFVDWIMPEMDGLSFVKAVRADRARDSLVLVMVTQQTHLSHVDQALQAGANEYLMKPFTPDSLNEKLKILGLLPS
jgi:two-component system chemotaxis response regulator CheY